MAAGRGSVGKEEGGGQEEERVEWGKKKEDERWRKKLGGKRQGWLIVEEQGDQLKELRLKMENHLAYCEEIDRNEEEEGQRDVRESLIKNGD